ncbi:MAG: methyltransferase domain-containing protein [Nitrospirae bacterium]|nr:methyltransferase domain-containing protein [Nitrospirota bacterium]
MSIDETLKTRMRYNRISSIFDLIEFPMEILFFSRWRRRLFNMIDPKERLLEVGIGTGKNLGYYPPGIDAMAIDISEGMLRGAIKRARILNLKVSLKLMDAEHLEFEDRRFDTVVATFVFCSVPDPIKGLRELKRVCKRQGRIILLEHMRPNRIPIGRLFDLLNPLIVRMMGVNINRRTIENIKKSGLVIEREEDLLSDIVKLIVARPA